jgi:hypothetical protein
MSNAQALLSTAGLLALATCITDDHPVDSEHALSSAIRSAETEPVDEESGSGEADETVETELFAHP